MKTNYFKDNLQFHIRIVEAEGKLTFHRSLIFNLVFVLEGCGRHYLHRNSRSFTNGDIFIVAPNEDNHFLLATASTKVFVIQFSSLFIDDNTSQNKSKSNLLQLFQYASQAPVYIEQIRQSSLLASQLLEAIIMEVYKDVPLYGPEYISSLAYTILVMVGENINACLPKDIDQHTDQRTADMLHYIHQNIFSPEKLTSRELSNRFFISQAYIGKYFKTNTSHKLHQYILLFKIRLIQDRLVNSSMRINEIAEEFGFTDKSYLNKIFVKFNGISPLAYRKNNRNPSYKNEEAEFA